MGAAELLDDSYPHGTPDGYRRGCRGGACPAPLACRDAYRRYAGDLSFRRLVDAGVPLDEILRRDAAEREGAAARDKAAARAAAGKPQPAPKPAAARAPKPAAAPKPPRPTASEAATVDVFHGTSGTGAVALDPIALWEVERDAWRARRKELYAVLRAAERAIEEATAHRDRAQTAFDEFVAVGEPQKPAPEKKRRPRAVAEENIRRLHAEQKNDPAIAAELGLSLNYVGVVRRELGLPAIARERKPKAPRQPRQVLGHGTNASYARGCRCDDCRRAQREYHRAWMESRRTNVDGIATEHHGTAYGYQLGCRSRKLCPSTPSCADASLAEERRRRREAGIPEIAPRVDAEPVRAHVRALMAGGMTMDAIAAGADVHRSRIGDLIYGRSDPGRKGELAEQIEAEKATRLLALEVSA